MATYPKKLKTLNVHLMLDSEVVTIADATADDMATRALNEFKKYDTMHYVADGATNAIPYHAVQYIEVTETDGSVTRKDPYGCDEGEDKGEVWFTGNNPETEEGRVLFALSNVGETDHIAELLNNGADYRVFLNGEELPYYLEANHAWIDTEDTSQMTKMVQMNNSTTAYAFYLNVTAPTSVEVSVKAK